MTFSSCQSSSCSSGVRVVSDPSADVVVEATTDVVGDELGTPPDGAADSFPDGAAEPLAGAAALPLPAGAAETVVDAGTADTLPCGNGLPTANPARASMAIVRDLEAMMEIRRKQWRTSCQENT